MLTDTKIKSIKPLAKQKTYKDGENLFLLVQPNGSKLWRYRYTYNGKQPTITLGSYPSVSLANARIKRDEYKAILANGIDPHIHKQQQKIQQQSYTFEKLLREWHKDHYQHFTKVTADKTIRHLELYVIPWLGSTDIKELTPPILLQCLRRAESQQKYETAQRLKQYCGQAFRYGVAHGHCERDITQDLRGALKTKPSKHMATITEPKEISKLLQDMETYKGSFIVKCALKLSPFVFVRPKELSLMKWADIDLEAKEWLIPADDMKMKANHLVPLCRQAITILEEIKPLTNFGKYVFHGARRPTQPINPSSVNMALKRLGYKGKIVSHGFRGMASTILNEHGFRYDVIEKQLAHQERNAVRNAYNHAQYIKERKEMMDWWGDYLESLKNQSNVIPFHRQA